MASEALRPLCPRCNHPVEPLSDHDRQALALAKRYPWVCAHCFAGLDNDGNFEPLELQKHTERTYYLGLIRTLGSIATAKTLLQVCEDLRAIFAIGSEVRYTWAEVAPELFRELWGVMDKIGGPVPPRPEVAKGNLASSQISLQVILDTLNDVVGWCQGHTEVEPKPPPDGPVPPSHFFWQGTLHPIRLTAWRLLKFLWDKDNVPEEDVIQAVWESDASDSALKSALHDLNGALAAIGVPWQYGRQKGHLVKK
jgi:hypothetical protein